MNKKILLTSSIILFINDNLYANFKFKLGEEIPKQVVKEIKEKPIIKINPKSNILNIIDKEDLKNSIKKSNYKIINLKKYKKVIGLVHRPLQIQVFISNKNNEISNVNYKLKTNYWYVIRKQNNILKFIKYVPLSKKDFFKFDTYIKIENKKTKILIKKNNDFEASVINNNKILIFKELKENFSIIEYKIKLPGIIK